MVFIAMLVIGPIMVFLLQGVALSGRIPGVSSIGAWGILGLLVLVIGVPIISFVFTFIVTALSAIFYNLLAPKIGGIHLEFVALKDKLHQLKSIPVIKFALITSIVMAIIVFIFGLISLIFSIAGGASAASSEVIRLVTDVITNFIIGFVIYALTAALYNFLAPRIGTVKLELE